MEQENSGREGNSRSVIQEIPRLLWKPRVHFLEKILKYTTVNFIFRHSPLIVLIISHMKFAQTCVLFIKNPFLRYLTFISGSKTWPSLPSFRPKINISYFNHTFFVSLFHIHNLTVQEFVV